MIVYDRMEKMAESDTCETHTPVPHCRGHTHPTARTMSQTTPLPDNDTTSMDPENSAIDHTDVESAAAAAAAALVALPQAAAAAPADSGQWKGCNM